MRAEAAKHQRDIGFSVSFRPIIADSEAEAWREPAYPARRHRAGGAARRRRSKPNRTASAPSGCGLLRRRAEWWSKRLWTGIAQLVGGGHNSTALVGTPEQVADALLDYYDLGVRNFLIRGFNPLNDAADYGRALLPIAREKAARRAVAERAS